MKIGIVAQNYAFFSEVQKLEKHFQAVDAEDAAVVDSAAFAGGKSLDIAPASVKIVAEGDTIFQFKDRAVGFPNRNIDRVAYSLPKF